jgi:hypothetical protein
VLSSSAATRSSAGNVFPRLYITLITVPVSVEEIPRHPLIVSHDTKSPDSSFIPATPFAVPGNMATNMHDGDKPDDFGDEKGHAAETPGGVQIPVYSKLELVSEDNLTFNAILRGTAATPLNTFEKKAALINAELDKFGMGRYQICIWFLCGFGYFLDLAWAQGVGLISTAIYQEMNVADKDTGTIFALANAGLAIGALGFGLAVDIIGRKLAFNLTCLITSIFGLLLVCLQLLRLIVLC